MESKKLEEVIAKDLERVYLHTFDEGKKKRKWIDIDLTAFKPYIHSKTVYQLTIRIFDCVLQT